MSPKTRPLLLFLLLLLLFPAVTSLVRWWQGESLGTLEWAGVIAFPVLAWLWLRYFSLLGCKDACKSPEREGK